MRIWWSVVNHRAESLLMDIYWDYRSLRVGSDHSVVPLTWSCWHLSCTSASQRSLSWATASGNELQKDNEAELRVALCLFPANHPDEYYHTSFSFSFECLLLTVADRDVAPHVWSPEHSSSWFPLYPSWTLWTLRLPADIISLQVISSTWTGSPSCY